MPLSPGALAHPQPLPSQGGSTRRVYQSLVPRQATQGDLEHPQGQLLRFSVDGRFLFMASGGNTELSVFRVEGLASCSKGGEECPPLVSRDATARRPLQQLGSAVDRPSTTGTTAAGSRCEGGIHDIKNLPFPGPTPEGTRLIVGGVHAALTLATRRTFGMCAGGSQAIPHESPCASMTCSGHWLRFKSATQGRT